MIGKSKEEMKSIVGTNAVEVKNENENEIAWRWFSGHNLIIDLKKKTIQSIYFSLEPGAGAESPENLGDLLGLDFRSLVAEKSPGTGTVTYKDVTIGGNKFATVTFYPIRNMFTSVRIDKE